MSPHVPFALPPPRITRYTDWLQATHGLRFDRYEALWQWSVDELELFWQSLWQYFELQSPTPFTRVLDARRMPGARWFEGAQVNYAQQVFRHVDVAHAAGQPALVFMSEAEPVPREISWPELRRQVRALARQLKALGVQRGDRIAAWLPNTPDAIVAFLACASVGAIWSVCSPDMGPVAVLDRFRQIEPVLLFAVDHQHWAGVRHDRRAVLAELLQGLPSLRDVVLVGGGELPAGSGIRAHDLTRLAAGNDGIDPEWLPFDHPIWIVYSSGTTGLPKAIVHGHGGVLLEGLKGGLHNDVAPSHELVDGGPCGERFHWFTSTGWIVWNGQLAALAGGTTVCLYDGSPAGPASRPDWGTLWRFADVAGVSWFGAGAAFFASCLKAGVQPLREGGLRRLRAIGATGSPLSADAQRWIVEQLPRAGGEPIWVNPISGGTDFAGAFVAGLRTLPVVAGEMQVRCLGAAVQAFDEPDAQGRGRPLLDAVGELVCTEPMPSMPLYFWNDPAGERLHASYSDLYRHGPGRGDGAGIWRHGDWIRLIPHGGQPPSHVSAVIYGRSDATINRHGVRMGTAELYRAVEALPEVLDSLVVDLEVLGRESWMPLFVVLRPGLVLDDALQARIRQAVREALSPRHVPSTLHQVPGIPRTLSGKKMELPVKKLLLGADPARVLNRDAMADAACVEWYLAFARDHATAAGAPAAPGTFRVPDAGGAP